MRHKKFHRVLCAALLGFSVGTAHASGGNTPHWTYTGSQGPTHWGDLHATFATCKQGRVQSPINLQKAQTTPLFKLEFSYQPVNLEILNNGHTVQVNYHSDAPVVADTVSIGSTHHALPVKYTYNSSLSISGESYSLIQFHFHTPSEHTVYGNSYPMEVHFVHRNEQGQLAVVGVMFKEGAQNKTIDTLWQYMPREAGTKDAQSGVSINAAGLLPEKRGYFHYRGSLTTPPCSEGVRWFVMREPIYASKQQIDAFKSLFSNNARPVQPRNERFLLESW